MLVLDDVARGRHNIAAHRSRGPRDSDARSGAKRTFGTSVSAARLLEWNAARLRAMRALRRSRESRCNGVVFGAAARARLNMPRERLGGMHIASTAAVSIASHAVLLVRRAATS